MNKTATLTYGNFTTTTGQVLTNVIVNLVDSAGSFPQTKTVSPLVSSATFDVPAGTGYHFLVRNIDQNNAQIGPDVVSGNFDVVITTTIQIVTAVSVA